MHSQLFTGSLSTPSPTRPPQPLSPLPHPRAETFLSLVSQPDSQSMSLSRLLRMEAKVPPASGSYHLSHIPPQRPSTRIFPPQALLLPKPSPVFLPHSRLLCPFHRLFTAIKAVISLLLHTVPCTALLPPRSPPGPGRSQPGCPPRPTQASCPPGHRLAQDVLSPAVLPDPHRPPAPQVTAWPRTFSARLSSQTHTGLLPPRSPPGPGHSQPGCPPGPRTSMATLLLLLPPVSRFLAGFQGGLPSPLPEASSPTSPSPHRAQTLILSRCHFHKDLPADPSPLCFPVLLPDVKLPIA
ncbi:uncharacterized protein LOC126941262 isoform X1 [Macaca thibetana thibetana]|uniref:uncharacterized protein LOC126941262 isoform X1 n=1 Tax=Macaca thibetana thibetana TaxID=257877 RepID=UPI0021BC952E|nr:uncharacterized protein LOC126941262 isoform X1 [Macaca thibetana thibetana]